MNVKNLAVVAGGYSPEFEISLQSAQTVMSHLDKKMYNPFLVLISMTEWVALVDGHRHTIDKKDFSLHIDGVKVNFDAVFVVIHGRPGENGELQIYFDMIGLPYTTAGSFPLAFSFNKYACNSFLKYHGILCAKSYRFRENDLIDYPFLKSELGMPFFVKSNESGSSFGVNMVRSKEDMKVALSEGFKYSKDIIIEEAIDGVEVSCGIIPYQGDIKILGVTEIVSKNEFFDYKAKYLGESKEITPARLPEKTLNLIGELTKKCYDLLRLSGLVRIDFIVKEGRPYFLEANTVPGLSASSLIPQQADYSDITLRDLFGSMVEEALSLI